MIPRRQAEPAAAGAVAPGEDDFDAAAEALRPDRSLRHARLREAAAYLAADGADLAQDVLERYLKSHPGDVQALNLLAEVLLRLNRPDLAEEQLEECLRLAPGFVAARFGYAKLLVQRNPEAALFQIEELLKTDPRNPSFRQIRIAVLEWTGAFAEAIACCRDLLADYPHRPELWARYGHCLRAVGPRDECIAAYRHAIQLCPSHGGAYLSLANLKTFRFDAGDIEKMEAQLGRSDLAADDRASLHFALGKAYGDQRLYKQSFENYAKGNALYRLAIDDDPDVLTAHIGRCKSLFTKEFFRERDGGGCPANDPIFIVGLPRSGSTLVEQILACHSAVEGIKELPELTFLGRHLEDRVAPTFDTDYPGVLARLDAAAVATLGERYLRATRLYRKLGRPHFTDKMGSNYLHIGMIQLMLPNARIVDVRRHPMACCFSNFTQHFGHGQTYSYRQRDLGRSYRDYVELMAHYDRVLPGKVHRVIYERLVADPETEIRRLLNYLDLPFEESCLQFHRNERVVTTVSSEQVRQPIFREGLDRWRPYEEWLGPLKATLGAVLDAYPDAPAFESGLRATALAPGEPSTRRP